MSTYDPRYPDEGRMYPGMSLRRSVRKGRVSAAMALSYLTGPLAGGRKATPKVVAWLKGRIAWEAGRKRTGK